MRKVRRPTCGECFGQGESGQRYSSDSREANTSRSLLATFQRWGVILRAVGKLYTGLSWGIARSALYI